MSIDTTVDLDTPPLRDGDRLTADEFHRRYEAMPHVLNANLIDGVVYMSSPISFGRHAEPCALIVGLLHVYARFLRGLRLGDNSTLRVDDRNEPQPDVMLSLDADRGGQTWEDDRGFLHGTPELVVEVAASSARIDAGVKRDLYERIGVKEYILWRPLEDRLDWWGHADGSYQPLPADAAGVIRSAVFPGLWLDVPALMADDIRRLTETLEAGLASPEHQAFADRVGRR